MTEHETTTYETLVTLETGEMYRVRETRDEVMRQLNRATRSADVPAMMDLTRYDGEIISINARLVKSIEPKPKAPPSGAGIGFQRPRQGAHS